MGKHRSRSHSREKPSRRQLQKTIEELRDRLQRRDRNRRSKSRRHIRSASRSRSRSHSGDRHSVQCRTTQKRRRGHDTKARNPERTSREHRVLNSPISPRYSEEEQSRRSTSRASYGSASVENVRSRALHCPATDQIEDHPDTGDPDTLVLQDDTILQATETDDNTTEQLPACIKQALGIESDTGKKQSYHLKDPIRDVWLQTTERGLGKENLEQLLDRHRSPSNFPTLEPPKINPEVAPILSQAYVKRDQCHTRYQSLVTKGASAIGRCLNYVVEQIKENPESNLKEQLLPHLADAGTILTHLFYEISAVRRDYILQVLSKSVKEAVKDSTPGEFLYGTDLGEKIKMVKNLEKAGNEIRQDSYVQRAAPSGFKRGGGNTSQRQHGPSRSTYTLQRQYEENSSRSYLNRQRPPRQSRRDMGPRKGQTSKKSRQPVTKYR
ncbi:unnamed protein product [Callosobruchus maculatus]|uniref:Uncharacterized protein n=1 Tax=Callosobruchus maculatus TaxID=64391 RepID=A0A653DXT5_CALMS|nr:unnamed protein product [Callosobruchus maculatus]